jgi:hypothetical protein
MSAEGRRSGKSGHSRSCPRLRSATNFTISSQTPISRRSSKDRPPAPDPEAVRAAALVDALQALEELSDALSGVTEASAQSLDQREGARAADHLSALLQGLDAAMHRVITSLKAR